MGRRRRRKKVEHTDDWELLLPLFEWPEQQAYEELRPLVLFGDSVAERARETGTPERTMYRRIERFEKDGMLSLFGTDPATARARRQGLEPAIRRMIVELKAEHPRLNDNEISNIVYVRTGRRLGKHTAGRVLAEEVVPLKLSRLFEPYHDAEDRREGREAAIWLQPGSLTVEYAGETLSAYDVELAAGTGKPRAVGRARLFETSYVLPQLRLFPLEEAGWLKALKMEGYASRRPRGPMALQEVLFPYLYAL